MTRHHSDELSTLFPDLGASPRPVIDYDQVFTAACGVSGRVGNFAPPDWTPDCPQCRPAREAWRHARASRLAAMLLAEAEAVEPGMWQIVEQEAGLGPVLERAGGRIRLRASTPTRRVVDMHCFGAGIMTGCGDSTAEAIADFGRAVQHRRQTLTQALQELGELWPVTP